MAPPSGPAAPVGIRTRVDMTRVEGLLDDGHYCEAEVNQHTCALLLLLGQVSMNDLSTVGQVMQQE